MTISTATGVPPPKRRKRGHPTLPLWMELA
jgi:hypothetical protein